MPDKVFLLRKVRCVADYQFGSGVGENLFPDNVSITFSRRTGRVRHVYLDGRLLATLRPSDGFFSLTIEGAERLVRTGCSKSMTVHVQDEASAFIQRGRNVFARYVLSASEEIRPREEVIVVNSKDKVLAIGKALLSGSEMKFFKRGVAVQVRRGSREKTKKAQEQ